MNDIDALLQMCLACPADETRRLVLCDALAEANESELETALRSNRGEDIIRRVYQLADTHKRSACLRMLWSVVVLDEPVIRRETVPISEEQHRELQEAMERMSRERRRPTPWQVIPPLYMPDGIMIAPDEPHKSPPTIWTSSTPPVGPNE